MKRFHRTKYLLVTAVIALILMGFSYAMAMQAGFVDAYMSNNALIEFIPDECGVLTASNGVTASVDFNRDIAGKIVDKAHIKLTARGFYPGARVVYNIAARNISNIPLTVDQYKLEIDDKNQSLRDLIRFSCNVKLYKENDSYYNLLGSFKNIGIDELAANLTSIMKYRKIDVNEKIVLEFSEHISQYHQMAAGKSGLSYKLVPVFKQYFPGEEQEDEAEKTT